MSQKLTILLQQIITTFTFNSVLASYFYFYFQFQFTSNFTLYFSSTELKYNNFTFNFYFSSVIYHCSIDDDGEWRNRGIYTISTCASVALNQSSFFS
jgi:hypothetical protein